MSCLLVGSDEDFDSMVYMLLRLVLSPYIQLSHTHRCSVRSFDLTVTQAATRAPTHLQMMLIAIMETCGRYMVESWRIMAT
jgi:hypothetical protein